MQATTTVSKWGNSFGIRIPKPVVTELGLKEGVKLTVRSDAQEVIIRPYSKRKVLRDLLQDISPDQIQHIDNDTIVGQEAWEYNPS